MDESDYHEGTEMEKSISVWRQSERRKMIDAIEELIVTSLKYAKSQYTPSAQRLRWIRVAGQMTWYKDQIMKNYSEEATTILLNDLKKRLISLQRDRESRTGNYPQIGFRNREDSTARSVEKEKDETTTDTAKAEEPESATANVSEPS